MNKSEASNAEKFLDFEQFEVSTLWRVYEKAIEIGSGGGGDGDGVNRAYFASLKIPALILLYELVNCNEMKASPASDKLTVAGDQSVQERNRQNAQILENLCALIDASPRDNKPSGLMSTL